MIEISVSFGEKTCQIVYMDGIGCVAITALDWGEEEGTNEDEQLGKVVPDEL